MTCAAQEPILPANRAWDCAGRRIALDRPRIMGVLNVTPDSFSGGGCWLNTDEAIRHGLTLAAEGADFLDVGGESTRPGADEVSAEEEARRVVPVIQELARQTQTPISVDTRKAAVAQKALAAGAMIVNDISSFGDPAMMGCARDSGAGIVLMHMQGSPETMQQNPHYEDVVAEVRDYLAARIDRAVASGIPRTRIVIDPGLGFGKTTAHNLELLAALEQFAGLAPVLVGASRKRFIGELTGAPVSERLAGSLAVAMWSVMRGAAIVRVHDVAATRAVLAMLGALDGAAVSPGTSGHVE